MARKATGSTRGVRPLVREIASGSAIMLLWEGQPQATRWQTRIGEVDDDSAETSRSRLREMLCCFCCLLDPVGSSDETNKCQSSPRILPLASPVIACCVGQIRKCGVTGGWQFGNIESSVQQRTRILNECQNLLVIWCAVLFNMGIALRTLLQAGEWIGPCHTLLIVKPGRPSLNRSAWRLPTPTQPP